MNETTLAAKKAASLVSKTLEAVGLNRDKQTSNIKSDEELVFFNTCAWLDQKTKQWNIPIHGWVFEPQSSWALRTFVGELLERKYGLKASEDTKATFKRRMSLFTADNERSKRVIIELKGQLYELPKSAPNGQFEGIIKIPSAKIRANKQGLVDFKAILRARDNRSFGGSVAMLKPTGVSVISDIDDTVKVSYISDRKRMFDAAFYQDFEAVKGMPNLYQNWSKQGADFHFVSSSPWQLYQPLAEFAEGFDFPRASFSLKKIRMKDETFLNLFKSGLVTKPIAIRTILDRYPSRKFVLVGDSSEQDPQAYAMIAREYPTQIAKIIIRNVHADKSLNEQYKSIFEGLSRRLWTTFIYPSQIKLDISKV